MTVLGNILYFPLELVYFTHDLLRITQDMVFYRLWLNYRDQPCIYCQSYDNGLSPRPLPSRMRKYRNRWLAVRIQPCIRKGRYRRNGKLRNLCVGEGGYVRYSVRIPVLAGGMILFWVLLLWGLLRLLVSG